MALAYTAPTWEDGSGTGISASQLQAICNCIEGLVQGTDKAVHAISMTGAVITLTFADGTQETVQTSGLKGIVSIAKTGTSGLIDTYTITYTDGTTSTFTVTNGDDGAPGTTPVITVTTTADAQSLDNPTVTVTKSGTDAAPSFAMAFSGLKGKQGDQGDTGAAGADGYSPEVTITSITGGHTVKITDEDHPTGQSFNVMDGTVPITKYSQTLSAGSTSVTFTGVTTTANSIVEVATSVSGLEYNSISVSGTSYTVTFDAQASNVTIYLIVTEVA